MFEVTIINNIKLPYEFASEDDLMYVARNIVIPLLVHSIDSQVAIDGGSYPPLEESTLRIKKKRSLESGLKTLIDTGRLIRSFRARKKSKGVVVVDILPDRANIGYYLQIEGVGKKLKHFRFFGVTDGMEKDAMKYINDRINKVLRKFNGK